MITSISRLVSINKTETESLYEDKSNKVIGSYSWTSCGLGRCNCEHEVENKFALR